MASKDDLNSRIQELEKALAAEQLAARALQQQRNDLASKLMDAEAREAIRNAQQQQAAAPEGK